MKPKIFLIDDDLANLIALEQSLEDMEYAIEKYTSAQEALHRMLKEPVNCVLVDVDLPDMDGLEFSRMVKNDRLLNHIPILLITGKVFSQNAETNAFHAGVFDYIRKPLNINLLKSKLKLLVDYSISMEKNKIFDSLLKQNVLDPLKTLKQDLDQGKTLAAIEKIIHNIEEETKGLR